MERLKIQNFEREHPDVPFPQFVTLSAAEAARLRQEMAFKAGFDRPDDTWALLTYLVSLSRTLRGATSDGTGLDLRAILQKACITPLDDVYINWDDFRTIDRMSFADLCRYFEDIWYPGPDDIEIFDDALSWILFIHHYGAVDVAYLDHEIRLVPMLEGGVPLPR